MKNSNFNDSNDVKKTKTALLTPQKLIFKRNTVESVLHVFESQDELSISIEKSLKFVPQF